MAYFCLIDTSLLSTPVRVPMVCEDDPMSLSEAILLMPMLPGAISAQVFDDDRCVGSVIAAGGQAWACPVGLVASPPP